MAQTESETKAMKPESLGVIPVGESVGTQPLGWMDALAIIGLMVLWGGSAALINPFGDFPLGDDFAYALPVKWLVETGRLQLTDWQYMTLITQILWGALFAGFAGFSFTVVRVSTLVIAGIGMTSTYLAGREIGLSRFFALFIATLFAVNPVFISMSETFHTDVPFWALTMLGVFFLVRGIQRDQAISLWTGWVVMFAAVMVRQVGLAVPIGLVVATLLRYGIGRKWLVRAVLPSLALFAIVMAYPKILQNTIGLPAKYYEPQMWLRDVIKGLLRLRPGALRPAFYTLGCLLMHLGWWMLPILFLLPPSLAVSATRRAGRWLVPLGLLATAGVITAVLWARGGLMPVGSSSCSLIDFGTGPREMAGQTQRAPSLFWFAVTLASAFGGLSLALWIFLIVRRSAVEILREGGGRANWLPVFLLMVAAAYHGPFCNYGPWMDRYAFTEMSVLSLLIVAEGTKMCAVRPWTSFPRLAAAAILLLVYLGFGVSTTHDYLAWNRARWEGAQTLMADLKVGPDDIDGGFEFNSYYHFRDIPGGTYPSKFDWNWKKSDEHRKYVLSFTDLPGYTTLRSLQLDDWAPLAPEKVLVLERAKNPPSVPETKR